MSEFYVYVLCNPLKNNEPFYVGKGTGRRTESHVRQAKSGYKSHKCSIIRQIINSGKTVIVKYADKNISEEQSFELEEFLIQEVGRYDLGLGSLTNMTNGGEGSTGYTHSQESLDKISAATKGVPKSESMKENLREYARLNPSKHPSFHDKRSGENHHNYGKPAYNKGVPMSKAQKLLMSEVTSGEGHWNFGGKHSIDTLAKMNGQKRSEETKEKMRKPKVKSQCECCGVWVAPHIINRFHNENCKDRP